MFFTIALVSFIACVVLHELAHWYEMERHGLRVVEAGLGVPIPYLTLKCTVMRRGHPVVLKFSPVLLGAYVKPDGEHGLDGRCYRCVSDIAGAGPISHLVIAFALTASLPIIAHFGGYTVTFKTLFGVFQATSPVLSGACVLLAVLTWRFRSFISAYILPILGMASLVMLVVLILRQPEKLVAPENGGPVAIGRLIRTVAQSAIQVISLLISLNIGLALLNAMPLGPTDGGQIFNAAVSPRFPRFARAFSIVGLVLILGLILVGLVNDARSFF